MKFVDVEIFNLLDFFDILTRFSFNLLVILILVRLFYYPVSRRKDYLFTYILIGAVVFLLCYLLENVKLQLGFAIGLFAIFGIIRYRTSTIEVKEMTYLFLVIGISVINALANKKFSEIIFANLALILLTYGLEKIWLLKHESKKTIVHDNLELVKVQNYDALKKDLEERTGLKINRVEIGNIDFSKNRARIRLYYYKEDNRINWLEEEEHQQDNS